MCIINSLVDQLHQHETTGGLVENRVFNVSVGKQAAHQDAAISEYEVGEISERYFVITLHYSMSKDSN